MAAIRQALGLTQGQLAHRMTETARELKLDVFFDTPRVSRMETGERAINLLDGVILARLDPQQRGTLWLATGTREVAAFPVAPTVARSGRPATARELGLEPAQAARKKTGGR